MGNCLLSFIKLEYGIWSVKWQRGKIKSRSSVDNNQSEKDPHFHSNETQEKVSKIARDDELKILISQSDTVLSGMIFICLALCVREDAVDLTKDQRCTRVQDAAGGSTLLQFVWVYSIRKRETARE